jgi:hypothetical protein
VEHFRAADVGIRVGGRRGWNELHGWDEGSPPPSYRLARGDTAAARDDGERLGEGGGASRITVDDQPDRSLTSTSAPESSPGTASSVSKQDPSGPAATLPLLDQGDRGQS